MPEKTTTRSYRSTLRTEQAAATRQRVLAAAAACFIESGYSGTSLSSIAERAEVSPETVKANGPKRALLLGAFEQAFAGSESDDLLSESDTGAEMLRLPGDQLLSTAIEFLAGANARTSVLWMEVLSAANADPAIDETLRDLLARRRQDYLTLFDALHERGVIRDGLDRARTAAALSFVCSPEGHQQLVLQGGWSMEQYRNWLGETITRIAG